MLKCKAAILRTVGAPLPYAQSKPISIEEIQLEPPRAGEVLVKIAGAGLCHSDLSVMNGTRPRAVPIVLGHEGSGEVVELGPGVNDLSVGDPVVFQFAPSCGRCERCLEGRPQICLTAGAAGAKNELMGGGKRIWDMDGNQIGHHTGVSCMAEYAVVDRGSIVVVNREIALSDAALFGCAVMTGVGAVVNTARVRVGDSVAVIGLGGVGLNGVIGAKMAGANPIIAIDIDQRKLDLAKTLGATHTYVADNPDMVAEVKQLTGGGVDFAVDLAGVIPAMDTAYAITGRGGAVVSAGLTPAGSKFSYEHADLVAHEKSILGSYMGSCVPVRDVPRYVSQFQQGNLPVDRLIDDKVGFEGLNEGFDRLHNGDVIRQIFEPGL